MVANTHPIVAFGINRQTLNESLLTAPAVDIPQRQSPRCQDVAAQERSAESFHAVGLPYSSN